jgi:membrane protease YdiL (CAAX protease family)
MAGFTGVRKFLTDFFIGLLIALSGLLVLFLASLFIDKSYIQQFVITEHTKTSHLQILFFIISGGFIAPFFEEFFFRACLLNLIPQNFNKLRKTIFYIIIGIIFVLPHITFSSNEPNSFYDILRQQKEYIFIWSCCSFIMINLYLWRNSIITGWVVHSGANIVLFMLHSGFLKV